MPIVTTIEALEAIYGQANEASTAKEGDRVTHDATTLMLPDRRGNNRVDSLRNIGRDPRVALLFMIPGVGSTLRSTVVRSSAPRPIC